MGKWFGGAASIALFIGFWVVTVLVSTFAISFLAKFIEIIEPVFSHVAGFILIVSFLIMPLFTLARPVRPIAIYWYIFAGITIGVYVWMVSFSELYSIWGTTGVIIGIVFAFVGVVPLAILAMLLHGIWTAAIFLIALAGFGIAFRAISLWQARVQDRKMVERNLKLANAGMTDE